MSETPQIAIVGAGGMGALFGVILQDGGLPVTLIDTDKTHIQAIREHGLKITGLGKDRQVKIPATSDAADVKSAHLILFQCKAHGTRAGAKSIKHLTDSGATCISFQNGLGNEEVIADEVGADSVLGGLTAMAGYMTSPGEIRDFARVPSYIGEMKGGDSERVTQIAALLSEAGLETHASADIRHDIWKKLLGNISMSALSGITNLTAAACMSLPPLRETAFNAMEEALSVAENEGITLDRRDIEHGMEMISTPGGTGDNKSSLCVDILNRRPTEVDYIYGTVIAYAEKAGIPVPTLKTLSSLVKGIESTYMEDAT